MSIYPGREFKQDMDIENAIKCLFLTVILLGVLFFLLWRFYHTQISEFIISSEKIEVNVINIFSDKYKIIEEKLKHAKPEKLTIKNIFILYSITGEAIKWPSLIISFILCVICYIKAPRLLFKDRFRIDGLQKVLAKIHPIGTAWINTSSELVEPAKPGSPIKNTDPALKVDEWLQRYANDDKIESIQKALRDQLGNPWVNIESLTTIEQCMFIVFSFFIERKSEDAINLLGCLSQEIKHNNAVRSVSISKSFRRYIYDLIKTTDLTAELKLVSRHAYTRTALLSLLYEARLKNGVVNPGLFSMIQLIDRELWIILSAPSYPHPGKKFPTLDITVCCEAAGAISHWLAECKAKKAIKEPQIDHLCLYITQITPYTFNK